MMGIKKWFTVESGNSFETYVPQIVIDNVKSKLSESANEKFKGTIEQDKLNYSEIGEAHPFDFSVTEGIFKKFGFANGVVNKYIDFIVGPGFYVTGKNDDAVKLIQDFILEVNFDTVLREWVKEALVKNGFLELGGKIDEPIKGVKILDAKTMYIKRDNKGNVTGFTQYRGNKMNYNKAKATPFKPFQVAHLDFNSIGDMAYGLGIIFPALTTINNLLQNESDLHMLMNRKANAPYHVKMGGVVGGKYFKPDPKAVAQFGKDLEWLNNKHEWVTDGLTEISVINFGNIGEKFAEVLKYDIEMLFYIFQIPSVLMGTANINEGIAKVQIDAFERRIKSFQSEIEKVVEQKIFKRILMSAGISEHVEFHWGRPSNAERYQRIDKITELLKTPISESLNLLLEQDVVRTLELNEEEYLKLSKGDKQQNDIQKKKELQRRQPVIPGQNAKPIQGEHFENCGCDDCLSIEEYDEKYNTIHEWLGFNYGTYVKNITAFIKKYSYDLVAGNTVTEIKAGKFSAPQIKKLKEILTTGFQKGQSISQMVSEVNKNVKPKDLLKVENDKIVKKEGKAVVVRHADKRAINIVRTEVTRAANAGAIEQYKADKFKQIKWVASFGSRTCPVCSGYDGEIFDIGNEPAIPQHSQCRCTVVPVTELG